MSRQLDFSAHVIQSGECASPQFEGRIRPERHLDVLINRPTTIGTMASLASGLEVTEQRREKSRQVPVVALQCSCCTRQRMYEYFALIWWTIQPERHPAKRKFGSFICFYRPAAANRHQHARFVGTRDRPIFFLFCKYKIPGNRPTSIGPTVCFGSGPKVRQWEYGKFR